MDNYSVHSIGKIIIKDSSTFIEVNKEYRKALNALEGFSYINVIWWFSQCDNLESRAVLETSSPYKGAPEVMGIFATRSPQRPNPIALTAVEIISLNLEQGLIELSFIDADEHTPILDIKPYTPSFDRVEKPLVPSWCNHWPKSTEQSGSFDWSKVFNF